MKPQAVHMVDPAVALSLSFGLGLIPWVPGSFGAAGAFVLFPFLAMLGWPLQLATAALLFVIGAAACGHAAKVLGVEDHPAIVWDETWGMLMVLILVPAAPVSWALGFLAFRAFDIAKPWPISLADDRLQGGLAIMLDDGLASLGAAATVWAGLRLLGL